MLLRSSLTSCSSRYRSVVGDQSLFPLQWFWYYGENIQILWSTLPHLSLVHFRMWGRNMVSARKINAIGGLFLSLPSHQLLIYGIDAAQWSWICWHLFFYLFSYTWQIFLLPIWLFQLLRGRLAFIWAVQVFGGGKSQMHVQYLQCNNKFMAPLNQTELSTYTRPKNY